MTTLSKLRLHVGMIVATFVAFLTMVGVNDVLFKAAEHVPGINWVYLPAGIRLLATLLFGFSGAVGLLLASWFVNFYLFFPDDFSRAFLGGIIAAVAPYMVYVMAQRFFGLRGSLVNHLWFEFQEPQRHAWGGFFVMATGDFLGSVIVFYTLKLALNRFLPARDTRTLRTP